MKFEPYSDFVSGLRSTASLRSGLNNAQIPCIPPYLYFLFNFTFFYTEVKSLSNVFCKFGDSQFVSTKSMMSKLAKYWSSIPLFNLLLSPDTFNVTHLIHILPQGNELFSLWQESAFVNSISIIDLLHICAPCIVEGSALSFADGAAEVLQVKVQILYCLMYMSRRASRFMQ